METHKILQADYLDLIFDNRNKSYGSYDLRKHYSSRTLKAFGFMLTALLLGVGVPVVWGKLHAGAAITLSKPSENPVVMSRGLDLDKIHPPKPPKPPVHPAATPPLANTIKNTTPVIVKNNDAKPDIKPPEIKDLDDKMSGPVNNPGQNGNDIALSDKLPKGPLGDGQPTGNTGGNSGGGETHNDDPVHFTDEMPEFPGGKAALLAYLQSHINYPMAAREADIQGKVLISFVVNKKGAIENAQVVRGIGGGCDKEALRVVNAMPAWKPGKQNGHLVKVYYSLPISFNLGQ